MNEDVERCNTYIGPRMGSSSGIEATMKSNVLRLENGELAVFAHCQTCHAQLMQGLHAQFFCGALERIDDGRAAPLVRACPRNRLSPPR